MIVSDWPLVPGSSAARGPGGVYTCGGSQIDALCAQGAVESRNWPRVSRSLAGSSWPCQASLSGKKPSSTSAVASKPPPASSLCSSSPCLPSSHPAPHALPWLMALIHQPRKWVGPGHCPVLLCSSHRALGLEPGLAASDLRRDPF